MKQRLLLSLLMLFVSVGLMKAAIRITVPAGTGTVKVSLSSDECIFNENDYPHWLLNDKEVYPDNMLKTGTFSSKEITYTLTMGTNKQIIGISETLNPASDWGKISLKIDGKVTHFSCDGETGLSTKIVGIEFVNNGELQSLVLGKSASQTGSFPALETLSCPDNKLNVIPEKGTIKDYNIGKQSPIDTNIPSMKGNAESFALSTDVFNGIFAKNTVTEGKQLSIEKLVDANGTAVPYDYDDVKSVYHFRDSKGVYVDAGTYKADIKVSADNKSYQNVVICNVPLQVEAATFDLTFTYDEEPGNGFKIQVNGVEKTAPITGLKKGDVITLTPIPNENAGYEFTGTFESNGGVSAPKLNGNGYDFTVVGNIDPEIKATFKLKDGVKVTWNTETTDGKITIRQNGKVLTGNEAALTVGSEIHIYVKANVGKSIANVKMGSTSILSEDENDAPDVFDAKVKVPADGANITVEFAAMTQRLTIKHPNGPASNTITIKDATGKTYGSKVNDEANSDIIADVPVGAKLTIIFPVQDKDGKYVGSVLVNGKTIPTEMTAEGTYVIKDFEIKEAVTMTVNVTTLKKIEVSLDKDMTYTYNGEPQAVVYTATDNLSDIEVYYGKTTDPVSAYKKDGKFPNAGTYKVYFKRAADEKYAELNTSDNPVSYTIEPAKLVVKDLPKISVDADKKYQITGGTIGYMVGDTFKKVTGLGEFVVLDKSGTEVDNDQNTSIVTIRYKFTEQENTNLELKLDDMTVPVEGKDAETIKVSVFDNEYKSLLVIKNGGAIISNGKSIPVGSTITFELTDKIDNTNVVYTVTLTDGEGKEQNLGNLWEAPNNGNLIIDKNLVKDYSQLVFKLEVKDNRKEIKLAKDSEKLLTQGGDEKNPTIVYDGQAHAFNALELSWVYADGKAITDQTIESINKLVDITYTINGEVLTEAPVNAGTYTVTLSYDKLKYFTVKPIQATLIIHKAEFTDAQVPTPDASQVALGQKLDKSNLSGQATIEGTYKWDEEKDASQITVDATKKYKVKFVPAQNYKEAQLKESVSVPVSNNPVITFNPNPEGGKVTVVNKNDPNDIYESGDEVFAGTELVITATPNEDFELASLTANGVSVSNPYTVKFDKTTIEIEASFSVKVAPGNFKVTIPESDVRGAIISGGGEFVVAQGGSVSFTVSTLSADANKVSVTVPNGNGTVKKGSNGRYTVSNIQANTTVRVSLSNPTPLKVEVQKSYLNDKKYHVGSVEIAEGESTTYYYGDVITVVAYPESGVKFEKWSDGSKEQVHEIELKGDMKVTATFSGIPTGIEDIESAAITTGKGFIMVKNVANAKVTVVSISGRLQAQEKVSGDTRIDVPQGIYVVVLESGSDVKRTKVIVK